MVDARWKHRDDDGFRAPNQFVEFGHARGRHIDHQNIVERANVSQNIFVSRDPLRGGKSAGRCASQIRLFRWESRRDADLMTILGKKTRYWWPASLRTHPSHSNHDMTHNPHLVVFP